MTGNRLLQGLKVCPPSSLLGSHVTRCIFYTYFKKDVSTDQPTIVSRETGLAWKVLTFVGSWKLRRTSNVRNCEFKLVRNVYVFWGVINLLYCKTNTYENEVPTSLVHKTNTQLNEGSASFTYNYWESPSCLITVIYLSASIFGNMCNYNKDRVASKINDASVYRKYPKNNKVEMSFWVHVQIYQVISTARLNVHNND